jgi:quercetin dioxygenase-like cupin family protein
VIIQDITATPGTVSAQWAEIAPGGESEEAYVHPGEEIVVIVSGRLEYWLDEREHYALQAGDALQFSSSVPHRWHNETSGPVTLLWVNVPLVGEAPSTGRRASAHRTRTTSSEAPDPPAHGPADGM